MDTTQPSQIGELGPESLDSSEPRRKVSRLLLLWPLAGIVLLLYSMFTYQPLDGMLIYWIGAAPGMIIFVFIDVAWRRARDGKDAWSFLPRAVWIAAGSFVLPIVLLANGALDHSPVEQHRQVITRTILEHGRHGSVYYKLEVSSWRENRSHEKLSVSYRLYLDSRPGDAVIVESHRGALGIPWLVSVHSPQ